MQTESKRCRLLAEMTLSAVRKNPQEPAQTRGSRQKKANRLGLAFKVLVEVASTIALSEVSKFTLYKIPSDTPIASTRTHQNPAKIDG